MFVKRTACGISVSKLLWPIPAITTDPVSEEGNEFGRVRPSVCFHFILTFEPFDLRPYVFRVYWPWP